METGKRKHFGSDPLPKKNQASRGVKAITCDKWIAENDADLSTSVWLKYERKKDDRTFVELLTCSVCVQHEEKVSSCKNYSDAFIIGSRNLRTSAFKDHAITDMHKRAMGIYRREQSKSSNPIDFAPIAKSLWKMDPSAVAIARRKFDVAYLLCKEHISFAKFEAFCRLEEQQNMSGKPCEIIV